MRWWLALALAGIGCTKDGGGETDGDTGATGDTDDSGDDSDTAPECPPLGELTSYPTPGNVQHAAATDLDGDGRLDLVMARPDGVTAYVAGVCGEPVDAGTYTSGDVIGLDAADVTGAGGNGVFALHRDGSLTALVGADLAEQFSSGLGITSPGAVVAMQMDTDGDHDAAVFEAGFARLWRIENTASSFVNRVEVSLPSGIQRTVAGDLGGGTRDEVLFMGTGLVEVVSTADFDYSDVRTLSGSAHQTAAIGDFDGDGDPDAAVSAGATVEFWGGDGNTRLAQTALGNMGDDAADASPVDLLGDGVDEVALVDVSGEIWVLEDPGNGTFDLAAKTDTNDPSPVRLFGGDVDGDGQGDVVVVAASGTVFVWTAP